MPVVRGVGKITLIHPKGSSAELLLYGATVISWKSGHTTTQPIERLFVSSKASLDGSRPVRGGIPIIFPCFGAPTHQDHMQLAYHGFARSEMWSFDTIVMDNDTDVSVRLTLEPTADIAAKYAKPFHLAYVITLAEHQLHTSLNVKNTSTSMACTSDNIEFQALFHNYIRAPANDVLIFPLQNIKYYDKTEPSEDVRSKLKVETRTGVDVRQFTDAVYEDAGGKYEVTWSEGGVEIMALELKDVVVWNPQEVTGTKIGDMEDKGWEKYVCVEPGHVRGFVKIEPGKTWIGQQTLSVINKVMHLQEHKIM